MGTRTPKQCTTLTLEIDTSTTSQGPALLPWSKPGFQLCRLLKSSHHGDPSVSFYLQFKRMFFLPTSPWTRPFAPCPPPATKQQRGPVMEHGVEAELNLGREGRGGDGIRAERGTECEQRGRATNLNLITGPHAQFSRHKGSEGGP